MRSQTNDRAVSTVVDISLALLLVSGSVAILATGLNSGRERSLDTTEADQTVETLSSITLEITYHVRVNGENYQFTKTKTAATHLRNAVLLEARVAGTPIVTDTDYPEKIRVAIRERLRGAKYNYNITAQWRPYEVSASRARLTAAEDPVIRGRLTMGENIPPEKNVSTSTTTVLSGMRTGDTIPENPTDRELSESMARIIVEGYFPNSESQTTLEWGRRDASNYLMDRYLAMTMVLYGELSSKPADKTKNTIRMLLTAQSAPRANNIENGMIQLLTWVIEDDIADEDNVFIRDHVNTAGVKITVTTWEG